MPWGQVSHADISRSARAGVTGRAVAAAVLAALLALPVAAERADAQLVDGVVATVGGRAITLSDTRAVIEFGLVQPRRPADATAEAVAYLVNRQLMLAEVDRYSAPAPAARALDARLAELRKRFPSAAAYERALARTAFTENRLRDVVSDDLRIEGYLEQRFGAAAEPSTEEVRRYYLDHPAEFTTDGRLAPFEDVEARVVERITAERRNALIAEWLDRLRRQYTVTLMY